jgi:dephospho-CoA kinase
MTPSQQFNPFPALRRLEHGAIPVIGLTGGIASGKSEVARMLRKGGSVVIDADSIGHDVLDDPWVREAIVARFGSGVLGPARTEQDDSPAIDRKALGRIVFADPQERRALEAIVHPLMRERFMAMIDRAMNAGGKPAAAVVLDAAILLEAGWDDLCDLVVFVDAPRVERMRRAARQRGWTSQVFEAREQAQWPCELKRRRADLVIANQDGVDALPRELGRLYSLLLEPGRPPLEPWSQGAGSAAAEVPPPDPARLPVDHPRRSDGDLAVTS